MFERTFSFWRRLVGANAVPTQPAGEERRVWARYPAEIKTIAHLNGKSDTQRLQVIVRDISLGGANLEVERSFAPGAMLSLELPCSHEGETQEVLACVVRIAGGPDRWSLGCVFSRELTREDLEGFGAQKERTSPEDQRTWKRFTANVTARIQKVSAAESPVHDAQVLNLSPSGIGLSVKDPVEAGALLTVDLTGPAGRHAKPILACVVHVTGHTGGDYSLGCNFIRQLQEDEWQGLTHAR
ncbi:MAG: PilZ domain-containing protein [Gemmataceae bacterium]